MIVTNNPVFTRLDDIVFELAEFRLEEIEPTDTFAELGLDSYFMLKFSKALESAFGQTISYQEMVTDITNFGRLLEYLQETAEVNQS